MIVPYIRDYGIIPVLPQIEEDWRAVYKIFRRPKSETMELPQIAKDLSALILNSFPRPQSVALDILDAAIRNGEIDEVLRAYELGTNADRPWLLAMILLLREDRFPEEELKEIIKLMTGPKDFK